MRSSREILDGVVQKLNSDDPDVKDLWSILTALRGPDNENESVKEKTTCALRGAIGMNTNWPFKFDGKPLGTHGAIVNDNKLEDPMLIAKIAEDCVGKRPDIDFHFSTHYYAAYLALKKLGYI